MPSKVFDDVIVKVEGDIPFIIFQQMKWTAKALVAEYHKTKSELVGAEHRAMNAEKAHKRAFNLYRNKLQRLRTRIGQYVAKRDEYKEVFDKCMAAAQSTGDPEFVEWLPHADEPEMVMGDGCHSCGPSLVRKAVLVYRQEQMCAKCFIRLMAMDLGFMGERVAMLEEEFEEM